MSTITGVAARRNQEAHCAGRYGKQAAFDQQLLHESATARADRQPQRHLALARGSPCGQEIRDVEQAIRRTSATIAVRIHNGR